MPTSTTPSRPPLHGFSGKDEYYEKCSSLGFLHSIDRPTLIINSRDDPFMKPDMLPGPEALSSQVTLEISNQGGHVGFVAGGTPWNPAYYLPRRIIDFLHERIDAQDSGARTLGAPLVLNTVDKSPTQ